MTPTKLETLPLTFFLTLFFTLFLAIFSNTDTNMAGLYIVSDLGGTRDISVYALVFFGVGSLLSVPLTNNLAARLGAIRLLVYTLLVYSFFSLCCALASTFFLFLLFRCGLGCACGVLYVLCAKLINTSASSKEQKEKYFFIMILFYAIVPVIAASVGGWLAYDSSWRTIFYFNEPLSLSLAGYFWVVYRHLDDHSPKKAFSIDYIGYITFVLGVGGFLTAMTLAQELDWYRSNLFMLLLIGSILCLFFFVLWELKHPQPIIELKLLARPTIAYGIFNFGLLFACYFGMIILITFWLHIQANYTPLWIGDLTMLMAIAGIMTAWIIKRYLFKHDPRYSLSLALIFFMSSCYYSTYFNQDVDFFHLAVARLLAGVGVVLFLFPLAQLIMFRNQDRLEEVVPLFQMVRILFSNLGAGGFVILWQRRTAFFHSRLDEGVTLTSQLTSQYFYRAKHLFSLTKPQSLGELNELLNEKATSLALNDIFGFMGYICLGLLSLLLLTFFLEKFFKRAIIAQESVTAHKNL